MQKETLTIAHWIASFTTPLSSTSEWLALFRRKAEKAVAEGADILMIPEHISEHWSFFCPPDLPDTEEPAWMAEQALTVMPEIETLARELNIAIVAGSTAWPHETTGQYRNRSWMFFPDREAVFHDKLVMTPSEKDCNGWMFEPGDLLKVFTWRGIRMALIICLDVEMPAVSHLLSQRDIDLLLVPSMTTKPAGYYRVFQCARARAVEQMTAVAVVGCVGMPQKGGENRDGFHSGASLYLPAEELFGHTGVFSETPLHGDAPDDGILHISRDIPLAQIRAVRRREKGLTAEAWPGPFAADHLTVTDEDHGGQG